jgi:MFS family permease
MTRDARATSPRPPSATGAPAAPASPQDTSADAASPASVRSPVVGLILVCAGALVGPLDTAVNVAFPAITSAFGLALRDIQWIVITFVIAQSGVTLVFGRLGDLYGHRRIFAVGMAACALAHLAAGFAPDYRWLVALRVLQGVAVGLAVACGPALATLLFPPQDKRRVLAIYVTTFSFGLALGPLLGGALIQWLGWPGVFWFRAPLALLVFVLLPLLADARAASSPDQRADPATLSDGYAPREDGARPEGTAGPAAPAGQLARMIRVAPVRSPWFAELQLASIVVNFACFSILLLVPYALTDWPDQSMAASGVLLALFPGGSLFGGLLAGRAAQRLSSVTMVRAGLLLAALGLLITALVLPAGSAAALGLGLTVTGLGLGLFQVGYMDETTSMLRPEDRGVAGGLVTVTRLLGIVLGVTLISALYESLGSFETTIATMGAGLSAFGVFALFRRRR